jgi:hypothetical protein
MWILPLFPLECAYFTFIFFKSQDNEKVATFLNDEGRCFIFTKWQASNLWIKLLQVWYILKNIFGGSSGQKHR